MAALRRTLGPVFKKELQELFAMDQRRQIVYINAQIERAERLGKRELVKKLGGRAATREKATPFERRKNK